MPSLVVDASAILSLCFEDEDAAYGRKVLDAAEAGVQLVAPCIWPLEVANAVLAAERRRRLDGAAAARFVTLLRSLVVSARAPSQA